MRWKSWREGGRCRHSASSSRSRSGIDPALTLSRQNAESLRPRQHVVQLQEIDDPSPTVAEGVVEPPRHDVHVRARGRHVLGQHHRGQLDQGDRRSLERLDEARGQSDRHAVAMPELRAIAGLEAELACGGNVLRSAARRDVVAQLELGRVVGSVRTGVDVADTTPRRQADVPDPAAALCRGDRLRGDRGIGARIRNLQGQRAVVEQHVLLRQQRHADNAGRAAATACPCSRRTDRPSTRLAVSAGARRCRRCRAHRWRRHGRARACTPSLSVQCRRRNSPSLTGVEVVGVVGDGRDTRASPPASAPCRARTGAAGRSRGRRTACRHGAAASAPDEVGFGVAVRQHERMEVVVVVAAGDPAVEARALLERGVAFADEIGLATRRSGAACRAWSARCLRRRRSAPTSGDSITRDAAGPSPTPRRARRR